MRRMICDLSGMGAQVNSLNGWSNVCERVEVGRVVVMGVVSALNRGCLQAQS